MKTTLRSRLRSELRSLSEAARADRSAAAARNLANSVVWRDSRSLGVFLSLPFEIDTTPILELAWRTDRRVFAPKVDSATSSLQFLPVRTWSDCLPGYRGILEPVHGEECPIDRLDLLLVPGMAFDPGGGRLGQGGGFYDLLLAGAPARLSVCGVAFEMQVVESVPRESHDRDVDFLVTDHRFRRCRPNRT
ncbi:MAG: 5-formyltetrahydrofolate cyclo-ligase [Planctomycetota bacterium]